MIPQSQVRHKDIPKDSLLILSQEDVERLLTDDTPDTRIEMVKKVAQAHAQEHYSLREIAIAEQIFRVMIHDTEVSVREALAEALKANPKVPREIVLALAGDVDEVALPLIEYSPVFTDADLITLIKSARHVSRWLAVARRGEVSEPVSGALVQTRSAQAITQLMQNHGATISESGYRDVLNHFDKNDAVMTAIAQRPALPVTVAEKVITLVSGALADMLRDRYRIAPVTIAQETEKTRETATLKLVDGPADAREVEKLIEQLQVFGRLTPSIILTSLARGNLYFFEASLARLSRIPVSNAQLLIHDKGGLGFKALYTKAGLPDKFFAASKLLLEAVADMQRGGAKRDGGTLAQKLLTKAAGQNVDNLSYILALIRQNG